MTRVLVTRPRLTDAMLGPLAAAGIDAIHVPTIAVRAGDRAQLAVELAAQREGEWTVVTSANGAAAVLDALGDGASALVGRVLAVGPSTARALRDGGMRVDVVPEPYRGTAIPSAIGDVAGRRVLLARGDLAAPGLARVLRERGATVTEVVAYRTLEGPAASRAPLLAALDDGLHGLLFASGSAVRGLVRLLPNGPRAAARRIPAFSIGPETTAVAERAGFKVAAEATEHTARGLAAITIQHLHRERP
jgi:uroporphyrinogen-III synthase